MARSRSFLSRRHEAAIVVGKCVFRIEPDRLVVIGDGAVEVAFVAPGEAATVVGPRVFRIRSEPDRLVEVGDGAVAVAFVAPDSAAVVVSNGVCRIEPDRLGVVGDGAVKIVLLRQVRPRL